MSYEVDESFTKKQTDESELDESCLSISFEANNESSEQRKNEVAIDRGIAVLRKYLQLYEEKAHNLENQLEQLGFSTKDLPDDLKSDLREALKDDNGVFIFPRASSEMVRINADHVLDSLQEKYELGQLQMLSGQLATLVDEYSCQRDNLERKLNAEKLESDKLDDKRFDKEANIMIFKEKLKEATWELENLQKLSEGNQKPKYSLDDLENFKQEKCKLESDIAFTNTKLIKYNNLSLSEKEAQKQLEKLKNDLEKVNNEIMKKTMTLEGVL